MLIIVQRCVAEDKYTILYVHETCIGGSGVGKKQHYLGDSRVYLPEVFVLYWFREINARNLCCKARVELSDLNRRSAVLHLVMVVRINQ